MDGGLIHPIQLIEEIFTVTFVVFFCGLLPIPPVYPTDVLVSREKIKKRKERFWQIEEEPSPFMYVVFEKFKPRKVIGLSSSSLIRQEICFVFTA